MNEQELMSLEAWNELARNIVAATGDQAMITTYATQATDAYASLYATQKEISDENKRLVEENEKLRNANLDLFLRVGEKVKDNTGNNTKHVESRAETITIDDLFKEE